jgi:hypothetical protein
MRPLLCMLAVVAAAAAASPPATAMTMTLGAKQDATMFENNPNNGSGGGNGLFAGTNLRRRGRTT